MTDGLALRIGRAEPEPIFVPPPTGPESDGAVLPVTVALAPCAGTGVAGPPALFGAKLDMLKRPILERCSDAVVLPVPEAGAISPAEEAGAGNANVELANVSVEALSGGGEEGLGLWIGCGSVCFGAWA